MDSDRGPQGAAKAEGTATEQEPVHTVSLDAAFRGGASNG